MTITIWGASLENDIEYFKTIDISISQGFTKNHFVNGKCVIVIRKIKGRLGNKMFMYSTVYGFARKRDCCMHYHNEDFNELRRIFLLNNSNVCLISDEDFSTLTNIPRANNGGCTFYSKLIDNSFNKSVELTGYWQSYRYFIDYEQEIRNQFILHETILSTAVSYFFNKKNIQNHTLIGVHIRRDDSFSFRHNVLGGFSASSPDYIINGMSYFSQKYSNAIFIIVSDDKLWCNQTFGSRNDTVITPSTFSVADDLAVLRSCHHNLITTGTYSWWSGYFSKGEVIYDNSYPRKGSLLAWNCPQEDYIPPAFKSLN